MENRYPFRVRSLRKSTFSSNGIILDRLITDLSNKGTDNTKAEKLACQN